MKADLQTCADELDAATRHARPIPQLTNDLPDLSIEHAYEIQRLVLEKRLARGERKIGIKLGFTSRAKMLQMGVQDLTWGRLTGAMQRVAGQELSLNAFIHPRVEPEVAFLLRHRLSGPITPFEAAAAIEAVAPALEIIDSRYRDFKFRLPDVIADNSSSAAFVLGEPCRYDGDIDNLGITLTVDGRIAQTGSSGAILGHPLRALIEASRLVGTFGGSLEAGDLVLAGAATAAERIRAGTWIAAQFQHLGDVGLRVSDFVEATQHG